jgi:hypothetical protein
VLESGIARSKEPVDLAKESQNGQNMGKKVGKTPDPNEFEGL